MEEVKCRLCGQKAELIKKSENFGDDNSYHCNICGYYSISGWRLRDCNFKNFSQINRLIYAIRTLSSKNKIIELKRIKDFDVLISEVNFPESYQKKVDILIKYLYENKNETSGGFAVSVNNCIMFGIEDTDELEFFITYAEEENLILFDPKFASKGGIAFLTSTGIKRYESSLSTEISEENMENKPKEKQNVCFLVHGQDKNTKNEVARFIENDLKIKVIILHEKASRSKTIIEQIESHSEVDFAVCLYTADDIGAAKTKNITKDNLSLRARQNVIFEAGYFMGKLGRENVIILLDSEVEKPSDNDGIIYTSLSGQWKDNLRKEIEAIYQ